MSYWYSLNTPCRIILSKQGYAKVDMYLPRRVVLVVDCIVQEVLGQDCIVQESQCRSTTIRVSSEIVSYNDHRNHDIEVQ